MTKPTGPNKRPMVSKHVAPGLRALLAAVDEAAIQNNAQANRARTYVQQLIDYLESDAYAEKSRRQTAATREWKRRGSHTVPETLDSFASGDRPALEFESYPGIAASPAAQAEFLNTVRLDLESGAMREGERLASYLARRITVGGEPFNQLEYLACLERASRGWDWESSTAAMKQDLDAGARALKALDPGLDLTHFVSGLDDQDTVSKREARVGDSRAERENCSDEWMPGPSV